MRTPVTENFYKSVQQNPGVFSTKGQVTSVKNGAALIVEADDTLLGQPIQIKAIWWSWRPAWCRHQDDPVINLAYARARPSAQRHFSTLRRLQLHLLPLRDQRTAFTRPARAS